MLDGQAAGSLKSTPVLERQLCVDYKKYDVYDERERQLDDRFSLRVKPSKMPQTQVPTVEPAEQRQDAEAGSTHL